MVLSAAQQRGMIVNTSLWPCAIMDETQEFNVMSAKPLESTPIDPQTCSVIRDHIVRNFLYEMIDGTLEVRSCRLILGWAPFILL